MRILLIKPKHIGDTLLLTPTVVAIKRARPEAEIWVVVRRGCEGILAGCPEIGRILTVAAVDKRERSSGDFWRGLGTMLRLLSVRFDAVFELGDGHRGRFLASLARTKHRYSVKPASPLKPREARRFSGISRFDGETCHRVEKDFRSVAEFFPLTGPIPPLRFDPTFAREWPGAAGLTDFGVLQIGKRQQIGRWTRQGWEEVGTWLLTRLGNVIITSGKEPAEVEEASWLAERLGSRAWATQGDAAWPEMAGLLHRAKLYVGVDTATMHLAAACQCPAVALFGSTYEGHWHPWQSPYRIVTQEGILAELPAGREGWARAKQRFMSGIAPRQVIAACEELLA